MEEKIDAMALEDLVATLSTCNEKVHQLKSQYVSGVSPSVREMKQCRDTLTEYMATNTLECIQVNDELYARLYHRVGTGETLTPLLFMEVINDLTPAKFLETVQHINADRERRKQEWLEEQRKVVRKELAARTSRRSGTRQRLTKRMKAESMSAVAESLGADAVKYADDIVRAASVSAVSTSESTSIQPLSPEDFASEEDYVEAVVSRLPFPEPEVKYTGKGKAYAQRPPPAFGRPLTAKEMCVEVLFELIRQRHKPIKPVVVITSRPGKVKDVVTVAPKPVFETIGKYVTLKNNVARHQMENRTKRKEYAAIMDRCKLRLQPLLGATRYEANLPTVEGLRKIAVEVVQTERVARRLSMWDIGCMMEDAVVAGADPFEETHVTSLLSEDAMSHLIREVLKQIAAFTKANTVTHERVRLRRGRPKAAGADDDDELADTDSDDDGSGNDSDLSM